MRLDRLIRLTTCVALLTLAGAAWAQPTKFQEAPMLAEQVKAGKLPPVEKRLPTDPLVVPVVERTGQYGGVWRRAFLGPVRSTTGTTSGSDRKSTRLNSSHRTISYAVFCLKKKKQTKTKQD